jgi:hypothetical protein
MLMRYGLLISAATFALAACERKEIVSESADKPGVGIVQLWTPSAKLKEAYGLKYCRSETQGAMKCSLTTEKHSFRFHGLKVDSIDVTFDEQTNLATTIGMTYNSGRVSRSSLDKAFNGRCLDDWDVDRAVSFDRNIHVFYDHLREVRANPSSKDIVCLLMNGTYLKVSESYSKAGTGYVELFQLNPVFVRNFDYIFDALDRKKAADSKASSYSK